MYLFQITFLIRLLHNSEQEFPAVFSKSLLVIHFQYSNVYVNPNLPNYPPLHLLPALITISLFSKSVSLLLFCK